MSAINKSTIQANSPLKRVDHYVVFYYLAISFWEEKLVIYRTAGTLENVVCYIPPKKLRKISTDNDKLKIFLYIFQIPTTSQKHNEKKQYKRILLFVASHLRNFSLPFIHPLHPVPARKILNPHNLRTNIYKNTRTFTEMVYPFVLKFFLLLSINHKMFTKNVVGNHVTDWKDEILGWKERVSLVILYICSGVG